MDQEIISGISRLTEIAAVSSISAINTRIKTSRTKGDAASTIRELEEIIQELIDERSELQRLATLFKEKILAESIDVGDIKYITETLIPVIEKITTQNGNKSDDATQEMIENLKEVLSPNILTILQLVGFNYKKAIGEPLTDLLQGYILNQLPEKPSERIQELNIIREIEYLKVAQDPDAVDRLGQLVGG